MDAVRRTVSQPACCTRQTGQKQALASARDLLRQHVSCVNAIDFFLPSPRSSQLSLPSSSFPPFCTFLLSLKMSAEDVFDGAIGIDLGTTYS